MTPPKQKVVRTLFALVIAIAGGGVGYSVAESTGASGTCASIPTTTVVTPAPETIRVLYSLDQKQNDEELIALIDAAKSHIYFAIYTFTLHNVADALIAAKRRGVEVYGIMDAGQAAESYSAPIVEKLVAAGIPIETEKHASGNGIMHIKALVTDTAYAIGSYNWTKSATTINDEILEIGTDPALRHAYENILKRLFDAYTGTDAAAQAAATSIGLIDYTEAPNHIGEFAQVRGTLIEAYTSTSGTVFLDFCHNYKTCPFSGVIFSDDASQFADLSQFSNRTIVLTGTIVFYEGRSEIVISSPDQLRIE